MVTERQVITETNEVTATPSEYQTKKVIFRTYQVVWYVLGVIEVILGFRVLLRLIGANSASGFVAFIYAISAPFAVPFQGVVPSSTSRGSVLEWSTLIAMAVYVILAYGIVKLLKFAKPTDPVEVETKVETEL